MFEEVLLWRDHPIFSSSPVAMPVALGFYEEAVSNYSPLAISVKLGFPLLIEALQVKFR